MFVLVQFGVADAPLHRRVGLGLLLQARPFLWAKNVIAGCSATEYCPGDAVGRDEMAKFLANAFGLQLYRP